MRVTLNELKAISQCPAYGKFLKQGEIKPVSQQVAIAEQVIQRCYINTAETGFRLSWRRIVTHVDKEVFQQVDISNKGSYSAAKKLSEYILSFIHRWYYDIYMKEDLIGFAQIPLEYELGGLLITDVLPIIKLSNPPCVLYIDSIVQGKTQLYNDIKVRGLAWLLSQYLKSDIVQVQHLSIQVHGGFLNDIVTFNKAAIDRFHKVILQVASLAQAGYYYPSITEKCENCPFSRRCKI